jgi:tRNA uridine 5-carboxymethylaminomethyl modification enzyme
MFEKYDVIVVGAGHAGCEAAHAAATMGSKVLLATMNMNTIAQMSCNPAMGGVAKGQIIREIDALGGCSGIITDQTMIQFRMLNKSKGPAMWSPRAQSDRMRFAEAWRLKLEANPNVDFWQEMISAIIVENDTVTGVRTSLGLNIKSQSVILTSGTFLNGLIHIGNKQFRGGRTGESASFGITEQLVHLGFNAGRMKTGTPPRVDGRSLNYKKMQEQKGDLNPEKFSYLTDSQGLKNQKSCWITHTNDAVHKQLQKGFNQSPMFNGRIKGLGPRYCPSIEDKISRFTDRSSHQIFVEPEGWNTIEVYVNGFSSSLPEDIQFNSLKLIPGFENVKMFRPGYAIEYDYFHPTQLNLSLETKLIKNLYFAGQINGTTGYEEAASQGLMAGINAHLKNNNKDPFIISRSDGYIGVLIDDLINKGTDEPYRMFTSRAEYRLLLRQDNADQRLTAKGYELGLASKKRMELLNTKITKTTSLQNYLKTEKIIPNQVNKYLKKQNTAEISEKTSLKKLLRRPQISITDLSKLSEHIKIQLSSFSREVKEQTEIIIKYESYIQKEEQQSKKQLSMENLRLKPELDYKKINSLSSEGREKLSKFQPSTLGQASRISGVSPADISILMVYLGR